VSAVPAVCWSAAEIPPCGAAESLNFKNQQVFVDADVFEHRAPFRNIATDSTTLPGNLG